MKRSDETRTSSAKETCYMDTYLKRFPTLSALYCQNQKNAMWTCPLKRAISSSEIGAVIGK